MVIWHNLAVEPQPRYLFEFLSGNDRFTFIFSDTELRIFDTVMDQSLEYDSETESKSSICRAISYLFPWKTEDDESEVLDTTASREQLNTMINYLLHNALRLEIEYGVSFDSFPHGPLWSTQIDNLTTVDFSVPVTIKSGLGYCRASNSRNENPTIDVDLRDRFDPLKTSLGLLYVTCRKIKLDACIDKLQGLHEYLLRARTDTLVCSQKELDF